MNNVESIKKNGFYLTKGGQLGDGIYAGRKEIAQIYANKLKNGVIL